ncbi:MAG: tetratricopeptide repeat protein [Thermoguttaceae bacterium]
MFRISSASRQSKLADFVTMLQNKFLSFILFVIAFDLASFGFAAESSQIKFVRGLVDRGLLESAEIFCESEIKKIDIKPENKLELAAEWLRGRTAASLATMTSHRFTSNSQISIDRSLFEELCCRFERELVNEKDSDSFELKQARILFRFQKAIADYNFGDALRLESETLANNKLQFETSQKASRELLFSAIEQFQKCHESVELIRNNVGMNPPLDFQRRTLALLRMIRSQWGNAQMALALTFIQSDDRQASLRRAAEILSEPAHLQIDDPIVCQTRVALATCRRLLGEFDRCQLLLKDIDTSKLTPSMKCLVESESIRFYIAIDDLESASRIIEQSHASADQWPDFYLAHLEVILALLKKKSNSFTNPSEEEEFINLILEIVHNIESYASKNELCRMRVMLTGSPLTGNMPQHPKLLSILAEDQLNRGEYSESALLFTKASQASLLAGDEEAAFQNAVAAVAVWQQMQTRLLETAQIMQKTQKTQKTEKQFDNINVTTNEIPKNTSLDFSADIAICQSRMIELLREVTQQFPKHSSSSEYHLKAIDIAANNVDKETSNTSIYFDLVREHIKTWPNSPKLKPLLFRACQKAQQQDRYSECLDLLNQIPENVLATLTNNELTQVTKWRLAAFRKLGKINEASALLQSIEFSQIEQFSDQDQRESKRIRAEILADAGKTQEAIDILIDILKNTPNDILTKTTLGEILARQNSPESLQRGLSLWTQIAQLSPKTSENWWHARTKIIEILIKLGEIEKAKNERDRLQLLYPELGGENRKAIILQLFQ